MRYEIVDAEAWHVSELAARLRPGDRRECLDFGIPPRKALWRSYRGSQMLCRTVFVEGEIAGMWGMGGNMLTGEGRPWMLTAPAITRIPLAMVKEGRREVGQMLAICPTLVGWVGSFYTQAIRYLETLDFIVETTPRIAGFKRFVMERK